jgi:alpha-L-rhamnosidase
MKKLSLLLIIFELLSLDLVGQFDIVNLKTNTQVTPIGSDISIPQFSWQMISKDKKKDRMQVSYQINVKDEKGTTVWKTKKIDSDISHSIQYKGNSLQPSTRYTWEVTVWDNYKKTDVASSWFETGLLNTSIDAWSGAQWIGVANEDLNLYAHYQGIYKIEYDLQLDQASQSTKASFVFGANDPRMMNKYQNLMGQENKKDQSYIAIELDLSGIGKDTNQVAILNIYRVGYTNTDNDKLPFRSLKIPHRLINLSNQYEKHKIYIINDDFTIFEFYLGEVNPSNRIEDASMIPPSPPPFGKRGLNLNPVGAGHDYLTFPMLSEIGFKTDENQKAIFSNLKIKNLRHPSNELFYEDLQKTDSKTIFNHPNLTVENGKYHISGKTFCVADPSHDAVPMLRTEFNTGNTNIKKARLYVTARGIYELYLNGKKVGNEYFNPGLTQYNKNHMYQTFDITKELVSGMNAIGAWLGEGWWSGNLTYLGTNWNYFGDRSSLLMKIVITNQDGTEKVITSNDKEWKVNTDGPIRVGSFFQGEVYDATKEAAINGWAKIGYDDSKWQKANEVTLAESGFAGVAPKLNYDDFKLVGQMGENVTKVKTLTAIGVKEVRPKVFVYDMGQNMVAIPQVKITNGKNGQRINMRFAEVSYPDLPAYKGNEGMVMMENIRAALATDIAILKGGDEYIQPRFTFHGYRYVEITGLDSPIPINDVKALVISSVNELSSKYETSDPLVNKLWENITWSLRSNFVSIPTDCPNRNERMGWSGDISVFARSATYLSDANLFLRRHLLGMRDIQFPSGRFTDVAPVGGGFGGTLWGSAGITIPWETYRQYGDLQLLDEHYDAMKKYVDFLQTKIDKETGILNEGPLGDWLSPEGNKNDNTLFWMSYYAYDLDIVSKAAKILGRNEDARKYQLQADLIKQKFNDTYIDKVSHKTIKSGLRTGFMGPPNERDNRTASEKGKIMDTQASYAIPLGLGTFNGENLPFALQNLRNAIERKSIDDSGKERPSHSLMTGFIGTASISQALTQNGANDLAYKLLTNKQYPSWLYSVVNGATSIWERLNSYTLEDGFGGNNSMNSFNHYSFGAVAAWMYEHSLGIQRHPTIPAFKEFVLAPSIDPTGSIKYAKGYYDSTYGRIESEWAVDGGKVIYKVTVPSNTKANLHLPATSINQIKANGKKLKSWKDAVIKNNEVILPLGSGTFEFIIEK